MKRSTDRILTTHAGSLPRPPDLLDMRAGQGAGKPVDEADTARAAAQRGQRDRATSRSSSASTSSTTANTASRASSPTSTSGSAASRSTASAGAAQSVGRLARGAVVSGILRRRRHVGLAPDPHGLHRADHLQGPRAAAARHRQPQGRAQRRQGRGSLHAGDLAVEHRGLADATPTTRRRRNISSPSPTRCARNTRRSSTPASCCRSTIRGSSPITCIKPDASIAECRKWARDARRGAQPRAARHPAGENPPPHLLRHQHGAAHPRHGAQAPRRHHPEDQRRRLFVRGGQPAPRARMEGVGERQAAGRQGADPGRDQPFDRAGRASGARRRAHRALRQAWSGART